VSYGAETRELQGISTRTGVYSTQPSEDGLDHIPNAGDLTLEEMASLRLIVKNSFMSKGSLSAARRARLVELGVIQNTMGGVSPTPAGRICARG
jgi:hypothetical protein